MNWCVRCLLMIAGLLAIMKPLHADELGQAGRDLAAQWQNAVVSLLMTQTLKPEKEGEPPGTNQQEGTGIIVDPTGLIASAYSAVDLGDALRVAIPGAEQPHVLQTTIEIYWADGTTAPGEIALIDKDADVILIRPKVKVEKPLTSLSQRKALMKK